MIRATIPKSTGYRPPVFAGCESGPARDSIRLALAAMAVYLAIGAIILTGRESGTKVKQETVTMLESIPDSRVLAAIRESKTLTTSRQKPGGHKFMPIANVAKLKLVVTPAAPALVASPGVRSQIQEPNSPLPEEDLGSHINYFEAIYEKRGVRPDIQFEANDGEYLHALMLLHASIALAPYDVQSKSSAAIWNLEISRLDVLGKIPEGYVTRELADPLRIAAIKNAVADSAHFYNVSADDIRAFAMYQPRVWKAVLGWVVNARDNAGIAANSPALLRYHVSGSNVQVEVK